MGVMHTMDDIILGKEYIFVPRPDSHPTWLAHHGRTVVPLRPLDDSEIDDGYVVDLNGPLLVFADELVDPED